MQLGVVVLLRAALTITSDRYLMFSSLSPANVRIKTSLDLMELRATVFALRGASQTNQRRDEATHRRGEAAAETWGRRKGRRAAAAGSTRWSRSSPDVSQSADPHR